MSLSSVIKRIIHGAQTKKVPLKGVNRRTTNCVRPMMMFLTHTMGTPIKDPQTGMRIRIIMTAALDLGLREALLRQSLCVGR